MPHETGVDFDQWPETLLEDVGVSVERATAVHGVIDKWQASDLPAEVAYSALTLLYYMNAPDDNDATRLYQQDMMHRFVFNADIASDRVHALEEHSRQTLDLSR